MLAQCIERNPRDISQEQPVHMLTSSVLMIVELRCDDTGEILYCEYVQYPIIFVLAPEWIHLTLCVGAEIDKPRE